VTRINLISVKHLLDQHLVAEYRELPMVCAALKRSLTAKKMPKIATQFLLNTGHVSFFYNKQHFLADRYASLVVELTRRGFVTNNPFHRVNWGPFGYVTQIDWTPRQRDIDLSVDRIITRVEQKPLWYRYKRQPVTFDWYHAALQKRGYNL